MWVELMGEKGWNVVLIVRCDETILIEKGMVCIFSIFYHKLGTSWDLGCSGQYEALFVAKGVIFP